MVPPLGIAVLELGHDIAAGMVGHPLTHPEGTLFEPVRGTDLVARAARADPGLLDEVLAACHALIDRGAGAVATSCGYFTVFQRALADRLPVPVFTSPLMELPGLLAGLSSDRRVLIVAAVAAGLDKACLDAAGVEDHDRLHVVGMDEPGHFRESVLEHRVPADPRRLSAQIAERARRAVREDPSLGAVLLECGEMPLAAAEVARATGLPVRHYGTYLDTAAAETSPPFGARP